MGIIKRCGLFGLLFVVSSIVSFIGYSDNASAISDYDGAIRNTPQVSIINNYDGGVVNRDISYLFDEYITDSLYDNRWGGSQAERQEFRFKYNEAKQSGYVSVSQQINKSTDEHRVTVRYTTGSGNTTWYSDATHGAYIITTGDETVYTLRISISSFDGEFFINPTTSTVISSATSNDGTSQLNDIYVYYSNYPIEYPEGYVGEKIGDLSIENWVPDIKLLQGSNWLVELSDYNFYTFDNVAFTCGEHELAPIINWEVWDITDDEDRQLIDTLVFGAPALVKYQAPKIPEDKRYEIVAYYSDCEGYSFNDISTKSFTVRKDGTLNRADYMVVCIREDFPFINIADCWAELNDYFVLLTFRVPDENELGGGVFKDIPDGCRELQVLDEWLFSPNQEICPQFSSQTRLMITPFISFALGLMAVTFVARRQGIRSLN